MENINLISGSYKVSIRKITSDYYHAYFYGGDTYQSLLSFNKKTLERFMSGLQNNVSRET